MEKKICMEATLWCPTELMFDIFSRLPSKTLARSKCVSKTVQAMIGDPTFVSMHHNRSISNRSGYIMQFMRNSQTCISSFDEEFAISNNLMIKLPDDDHPYCDNGINIVGCSNGLLCFTRKGLPFCTYLWNPSMRVAKELPCPFVTDLGLNCQDWSSSFYLTGFGFDSESDDYKLVQIIFEKPNRKYAYNYWTYVYDISRVYSLKTNSWRSVWSKLWNEFDPCIDGLARTSGTCFKDCLYWVSHDLKFIMSFILSNDLFETISLPSNQILEEGMPLMGNIGSLEESLALFVQYKKATRVWLLKESKDGIGSWTKRFTIDLGFLACPIDFALNGKLLMLRMYSQRRTQAQSREFHSLRTTLCRLGLWDFEEKKFGELRINGEEDIQQVFDVHSFDSACNPLKLKNLMNY